MHGAFGQCDALRIVDSRRSDEDESRRRFLVENRYLVEKLAAARNTVIASGAPVPDRLLSAFVHNLASLELRDFPDDEGRAKFESIDAQINALGEAIEGAGSAPTTLAFMDEAEALRLAARIIALCDRYVINEPAT